MDPAYISWFFAALFGAVLGLFVRPMTVLMSAVALFGISVVGLIVTAVVGAESLTWMFGIAAMALPVLGAVTAVGSVLGRLIRERLGTNKKPN